MSDLSNLLSADSPNHEIQSSLPDQSLWGRLPDEIKQEILKNVFLNTTVKFRSKPDSATHTTIQGTKHATVELRKAPKYLLPNLFVISKKIFNKDEVVDAIVRSAQIRLQTATAVNKLSKQLTSSQRQVLKRILIRTSGFLPLDLKSKIGRHVVRVADYIPPGHSGSAESSLCVPVALLVETTTSPFIGPPSPFSILHRSFKLDDPSKLDVILGTKNSMMLGLFIRLTEKYDIFPMKVLPHLKLNFINTKLGRFVYSCYQQDVEAIVEFDLTLCTDNPYDTVKDARYRAESSTKDWIIRASNGKMRFSIAQPLTKKFFDEELTANGSLRHPGLNVWDWATHHLSESDIHNTS